jgi:hypothetical protein
LTCNTILAENEAKKKDWARLFSFFRPIFRFIAFFTCITSPRPDGNLNSPTKKSPDAPPFPRASGTPAALGRQEWNMD